MRALLRIDPVVDIAGSGAVMDAQMEVVERKGLGHPDYICDSVMEAVSVALCRAYMDAFGQILHHNVDKGLLVAGEARKTFGKGRIIKPMELIIGDRATFSHKGKKIPVERIAKEAALSWFEANLKRLDARRNLSIKVALAPGSGELSSIFVGKKRALGANDTSAAAGYAPMTPLEKAVFDCERFINSGSFKQRFPEAGEDVKVMGFRNGSSAEFVVACPLMALHIESEKAYFAKKKAISSAILEYIMATTPFAGVTLKLNTLDRRGRGATGVYLSLLGTSAEDADSGQVGRGNRVNGVISLYRPMGTEAAAGKNPTSHVGKIYSVFCHKLANDIYRRVEGLREVYVWMASRIGDPVDAPAYFHIRLVPSKPRYERAIKSRSRRIALDALDNMGELTKGLSLGLYPVC